MFRYFHESLLFIHFYVTFKFHDNCQSFRHFNFWLFTFSALAPIFMHADVLYTWYIISLLLEAVEWNFDRTRLRARFNMSHRQSLADGSQCVWNIIMRPSIRPLCHDSNERYEMTYTSVEYPWRPTIRDSIVRRQVSTTELPLRRRNIYRACLSFPVNSCDRMSLVTDDESRRWCFRSAANEIFLRRAWKIARNRFHGAAG